MFSYLTISSQILLRMGGQFSQLKTFNFLRHVFMQSATAKTILLIQETGIKYHTVLYNNTYSFQFHHLVFWMVESK